MKSNMPTPASMTRAQGKKFTQQAIKDAASARFFSIGFTGTSLSDIASDASVKVPLVVYHFKNKEGLWKACVNDVFARLDAALEHLFDTLKGLSGEAYLRALLTGYIKSTASAPEYMRLLFLEGMQQSDRLEWLVDTHQRHHSHLIMNIIEQAQNAGTFKKVDIMHAKYILASAVASPFILAPEFKLISGQSADDESVINKHVDTCLSLLFDLPKSST
ncbi:TetR/AcrR family transcriptional regulator [Ningiella sp. W23]|uniref:TetR/AcrR family transcriptional regulator n=1 Tax=Ningiella sp. W23 TaxID=3023715 RepID=UPI0037570A48